MSSLDKISDIGKKKVKALIQARLGSTRLPKKVFIEVLGKPLLLHLIERIRHSKYIDEVIILTTTNKKDDELATFCLKHGIKFFRGNEEDVLDRYYQAAKLFKIDPVVRITSDCPLIDPKVTDKVIEKFFAGNYDFVSTNNDADMTTDHLTWPDGLDTWAFSFDALERSWKEAKNKDDREHVTMHMVSNPDKFRLGFVDNKENLFKKYRWTIDYPEDLEVIKAVFENLYREDSIFHMEDIIEFLKKYPKIQEKNVKYIE